MKSKSRLAIVGATGAVGIEMLRTLERRKFPAGQVSLLASARSKGKILSFRGEDVTVEELNEQSFNGVDIALFSAGGETSREFAPIACNSGCVVIDNSSAFRMDDSVPLVVPEINPEDLNHHQGIIANPNCSTIVALMALSPLHQAFTVTRFIASTYQAVSGSGAKALAELKQQVEQIVRGEPITQEVYPHQIAFNVLPHVDRFLESGYTKEEMKMVNEGRKILHHRDLRGSVTCVRVPVYRAHSIAMTVEFEKPMELAEARAVLNQAAGLEVIDDPSTNQYPLPLIAAEKDLCQVGRIRRDSAFDNGLSFWVVGDQLLKGAALNAVQIAETLIHESPSR